MNTSRRIANIFNALQCGINKKTCLKTSLHFFDKKIFFSTLLKAERTGRKAPGSIQNEQEKQSKHEGRELLSDKRHQLSPTENT
jgi:hypothetical protein